MTPFSVEKIIKFYSFNHNYFLSNFNVLCLCFVFNDNFSTIPMLYVLYKMVQNLYLLYFQCSHVTTVQYMRRKVAGIQSLYLVIQRNTHVQYVCLFYGNQCRRNVVIGSASLVYLNGSGRTGLQYTSLLDSKHRPVHHILKYY